jgi:hypothetical protein
MDPTTPQALVFLRLPDRATVLGGTSGIRIAERDLEAPTPVSPASPAPGSPAPAG